MPITISREGRGSSFLLAVFTAALAYLIYRMPTAQFFLGSVDHGYQIALGAAVLNGRIPGVDSFTVYGPLVGVSSALGLFLSQKTAGFTNLAGEVTICAAFYALAIALLADMIRRLTRPTFGIACAVILILLFPRYYKWYYWFWPIVTMLLFWSCIEDSRPNGMSRWRLVLWGILSGIGVLYRLDLGLMAPIFAGGMLLTVHWARASRPVVRCAFADWLWFMMGVSVASLLWVVTWVVLRDSASWLILSIKSSFVAATDDAVTSAIAPFQFSHHAASSQNILASIQLILPLAYVGAFCYGAWQARKSRGSVEHLIFAGVALIGLGICPQAYHRADGQHLLQVIWPAPVLVLLAFERMLRGERWLIAIVLPMTVVLVGIMPEGGMDFPSLNRNWIADWRRLGNLPDSMADNPTADIAIAVRNHSHPGDSIFIVAPWTTTPILYFTQTYQPGLQPVYVPGILTGPDWLARDRALLLANPPSLLVVSDAYWQSSSPEVLAPYIPDLIERWHREYSVVVRDNGTYRLLRRPSLNGSSGVSN